MCGLVCKKTRKRHVNGTQDHGTIKQAPAVRCSIRCSTDTPDSIATARKARLNALATLSHEGFRLTIKAAQITRKAATKTPQIITLATPGQFRHAGQRIARVPAVPRSPPRPATRRNRALRVHQAPRRTVQADYRAAACLAASTAVLTIRIRSSSGTQSAGRGFLAITFFKSF